MPEQTAHRKVDRRRRQTRLVALLLAIALLAPLVVSVIVATSR